jgi:hypothetical protein
MDFMNERNTILVPNELVAVANDAFPYPKDSHWAQPSIEFAADFTTGGRRILFETASRI